MRQFGRIPDAAHRVAIRSGERARFSRDCAVCAFPLVLRGAPNWEG